MLPETEAGGQLDVRTGPASSGTACGRQDSEEARSTRPSAPAEGDPRPDDHSSATERIDHALHTLKSELLAMREQDLQLLKQLIHINDSIRRLKRARWLQTAGRTASCGTLGVRTPSDVSSQAAGGAKERGPVLLRQQSEPGLFAVPLRRVATLSSTSSFETIDDTEEADSLYGSATDLDTQATSQVAPSTLPTPVTRQPPAYTSLTFTQEELGRGESSYGEILKRNVRLWKWSVAREKDLGITYGHPCVL